MKKNAVVLLLSLCLMTTGTAFAGSAVAGAATPADATATGSTVPAAAPAHATAEGSTVPAPIPAAQANAQVAPFAPGLLVASALGFPVTATVAIGGAVAAALAASSGGSHSTVTHATPAKTH